jgi:hypothetical protein
VKIVIIIVAGVASIFAVLRLAGIATRTDIMSAVGDVSQLRSGKLLRTKSGDEIMKPLRDLRPELRRDLDDLRAKYLLRGPYGYLSAVLQKRRKWPKIVPSFESFVALLTDVTGKTFDGRVEKSGTRLFIEVSCSAGPQSKAR